MLFVIIVIVAVVLASRSADSAGEADAALQGALKGAVPKAEQPGARGLNDPTADAHEETKKLDDGGALTEERFTLKIPDPEPEVTMKGLL